MDNVVGLWGVENFCEGSSVRILWFPSLWGSPSYTEPDEKRDKHLVIERFQSWLGLLLPYQAEATASLRVDLGFGDEL